MIIYITDRNLNVMTHASTSLPEGFRIFDDKTVERVETGTNTFECSLSYSKEDRWKLETAVQVGNYILKQGDGSAYDSVYQITDTELDTKAQELHLYAEDAGLDLLNTICPATTITADLYDMLSYFLPTDWEINIIDAPTGLRQGIWDGESTATERILSVANLFGCEVYYSFDIKELKVNKRIVNVVKKRGSRVAVAQLRLNFDIDNIRITKSIANIYTALEVTGGIPEGADTPIDLKNYGYYYEDPTTGDVYEVELSTGRMLNTTAMKRWSSAIDTDGLSVGSFSYNTTDVLELAERARIQLQRDSQVAVNYEVDFFKLPDNIAIGDRVNIIDEQGRLYLEARLLEIETSASEDTKTAIIGEYLIRGSGIAERVAQLAVDLQNTFNNPVYSLEIVSSNGDVFIDTTVATVLTAYVSLWGKRLTDAETANAGVIKWYDGDTLLGTGKTYTITEASQIDAINVTAKLEN